MTTLPLRQSQLADLAFMIAERRCGILHDPGVGKTPPVCVMAWYVWTTEGKRTVLVQPASLMRKNAREMQVFTPFKEEDIAVFDGSKTEKENLLCGDAKVLIMTAAHWRTHWRTITERFPDIGLFAGDEWHMLYATMDSKRTAELAEFFWRFPKCRLLGMTGSLIAGRLSSAYPLIHLIQPRYYGNHQAFMNYHAVRDDNGKVVSWKNHDRIATIMGKHGIRRSFADEYGPESKVLLMEKVDMNPKMKEAYDEFHEMAALELENTILDGSEPGAAAIRARQILAHPEVFGLCKSEKTGKDERFSVHLEDYRQTGQTGFVAFSALVPEAIRVHELIESFGFKCGLIHGGIHPKKRADIDAAYQAGELDAISATPGTAAVGYNWHRTTEMHMISTNYQDVDFMQAMKRGLRGKRDNPLKVWVYRYRNTIEEHIHRVIERKSEDAWKVDNTVERIRFPRDDESGIDLNFFLE